MSRAARFAAVLGTLHAAHDLADHVIQTDAQAAGKAHSWRAMAGHIGSYHATAAAALLAADRVLGLGLTRRRLAAALAVSAGTHALLDRRWPVRKTLEATGSPSFAAGTAYVPQHSHPPMALNASATAGLVGSDGLLTVSVPAPIPLHGPYLADQALHHTALWLATLIAAAGRR